MIAKTIKHYIATCLVCCGLAATVMSCSDVVDYNDGYTPADKKANTGAPVITAVYDVADTEQILSLTSAERGQRLCIVGENLNNLKSLTFNTIEADLSQTYTASTMAIVQVPEDYSKLRENTLIYTTDKGTATYSFSIALPQAEVYGLLNEFAKAGTDASVAGKNLEYYDFTLTLNGEELPLTVADDKLTFHIPEGTPDNSVFIITWLTPEDDIKRVELPFRHTDNLLFADLTKTAQQQTDRSVTVEMSDMGQPCLHFNGTITEWSWVELSFAQPFEEICSADAVSQYNFVFEVQNAEGKPLLDKGYEFAWNWDWNNSYRWNPGEGFDTAGQWQTVRFPLEQMAPNGLTALGTDMVLNVGFQPYRDYEADFRLANFRIEKK